MADQKISSLTELTALAEEDFFAVVDDPSGSPITKKVSALNLWDSLRDLFWKRNYSTTSQGAGFSSDTYLTGSDIAIPANYRAGSIYRLIFSVSKTAAGTATPVITVRFGTNASTSDTARLTFTFNAGTAAADVATFEVIAHVRSHGTSGILQGTARVIKSLSTTGFINTPSQVLQVTSSSFDMTVANSKIGVSVNGGASASWTVQQVLAELIV